jgi:hypothetical protein
MKITRLVATIIFATSAIALAQDPPVPVPPPPPAPPQPEIVPVPVPEPAAPVAVPVPADEYDRDHYVRRDDRWLPPSRVGFGMILGGGVTDYIDNRAHDSVALGPEWAARIDIGTRSPIGAEAAYVGSTQRVQGLSSQSQLMSNGAQGLLRVNIVPRAMVQPYVAAGLGWRHYSLMNASGAATSDISDRTDVGEVPAATGIALRGQGFILDGRFNVGIPFNTTAVRSLSGINGTTWGVNANLGFEF